MKRTRIWTVECTDAKGKWVVYDLWLRRYDARRACRTESEGFRGYWRVRSYWIGGTGRRTGRTKERA